MFMKELWDIVPNDTAEQFNHRLLLDRVISELPGGVIKVLDLGCGDGRSIDLFRERFSELEWIGLDLESSPEVESRSRTDCNFFTYNGVDIPFDDNNFDIIYSNHVFEHVRYPEALLKEVCRVLKGSGAFVGSVSYLQPLHSFSYFNYTPFGWYQINKDAGLSCQLLAGGIDSLALVNRDVNRSQFDNKWWNLSPLNQEILSCTNLSIKEKNYKILMFSGVINFICRK